MILNLLGIYMESELVEKKADMPVSLIIKLDEQKKEELTDVQRDEVKRLSKAKVDVSRGVYTRVEPYGIKALKFFTPERKEYVLEFSKEAYFFWSKTNKGFHLSDPPIKILM